MINKKKLEVIVLGDDRRQEIIKTDEYSADVVLVAVAVAGYENTLAEYATGADLTGCERMPRILSEDRFKDAVRSVRANLRYGADGLLGMNSISIPPRIMLIYSSQGEINGPTSRYWLEEPTYNKREEASVIVALSNKTYEIIGRVKAVMNE